MMGEVLKTGFTKETWGSVALVLVAPDVAKYGDDKALKDKLIMLGTNSIFDMGYSLTTSACRQAYKSSGSRSSRSSKQSGYKVLKKRLVKRGHFAYQEIQYMYNGRIYYNRVYM